MSQTPFVCFCGSRRLPPQASGLVAAVVRAVAASGRGVAVGCAVGADLMALRAALGFGAPVQLFAVGSVTGAGFWSRSSFSFFRPLWGRAPRLSVSWLAGGPLSLPLPVRLLRRSLACVWFAAISDQGRGCVAFVKGGFRSSPGSWRTVRASVRFGLPVVVFPVGCQPSCFPVFPGFPGSWVPAARSGVWSRGFRFVPSQV